MSCDNWEAGTVTLPTAAWAGFKKDLREAYNEHMKTSLSTATGIYEHLKTNKIKKWDWDTTEKLPYVLKQSTQKLGENFQDKLRDIFKDGIYKPTLQDFAPAKITTKSFDGQDCYISLDDEKRSMRWSVPEGNRNVDRAHENFLYAAMNKALKQVKWTRGTGGHFAGNDEYNGEGGGVGAGANYLTGTFGPLGDQAKIDDYVCKGFKKTQAKKMVEEGKKTCPSVKHGRY